MNFLRNIKSKLLNWKPIAKLRQVKNVEIVIAVILALIAAVAYFVVTAGTSEEKSASTVVSAQMTETEARLAEMISEISGVGKSRVLITTGEGSDVIGVIVVAEGAENMTNRVNVIRCVEKATGATVDEIAVFEMQKGG